MVGCVRQVVEQSTGCSYRIEDGTGHIEARVWHSSCAGDDSEPFGAGPSSDRRPQLWCVFFTALRLIGCRRFPFLCTPCQ